MDVAIRHDFGSGAHGRHDDEVTSGRINFLSRTNRLINETSRRHHRPWRRQRTPWRRALAFCRLGFMPDFSEDGELFCLCGLLLNRIAAAHTNGRQSETMHGLKQGLEVELPLLPLGEVPKIQDDRRIFEKFRGLPELFPKLILHRLETRAQDLQDRQGNGTGFELDCGCGRLGIDGVCHVLSGVIVFPYSSIRLKTLRMKIPPLRASLVETQDLIWPDPQRSIVHLLSSLALGLDGKDTGHKTLPSLPPQEIRSFQRVVLIVIDGLGQAQLEAHAPRGILFRGLEDEVTSVFPSTTASAVTTLMTGCAPKAHGLVGWHMFLKELGAVLAILPGRPRYGGCDWSRAGIDLQKLLDLTPFPDRIQVPSSVYSPKAIAESSFNRTARGRAEGIAFTDLENFFELLETRLLKSEERTYHYAYWSQFDHIAHETGAYSPRSADHLKAFERAFERFLLRIRGRRTLVIVTADHGFIDHDPAGIIDLEDYPTLQSRLILPLSGEARAAYAYVREGEGLAFERDFQALLSDRALIFRSQDLIRGGAFGEGPEHPRLSDRVGDYTLIPKGRNLIRDRLFGEKKTELIGVHGGVSQEEMWVPVIVHTP